MRSVIILFAKAPVTGQVKTRLIPRLGPEDAARLHTAFVADMIERLQHFPGAALELHTDIPSDAWKQYSVARKLQIPGDLGLKMFHSLSTALTSGYERAMVVGTDAPTLPPDHLAGLLESSADVALGPTEDGGYYAISAKRTHLEMFKGVAWSTVHTLRMTLEAFDRCGLTHELGETWFDIDEPADLERLRACPDLPPHTRAMMDSRRS